MSDSVRPHGLQPPRLLCPWDSPGKNTGVGCCAHLQGIFPTQGSDPGLLLLTCTGRWVPYQQCHLGSPKQVLNTNKKWYTPTFHKLFQCLQVLARIRKYSLAGEWVHRFLKLFFKSFQFSSVAQSCPTLCNPMNRSTPGLPVHHQLPEFTQTHVH